MDGKTLSILSTEDINMFFDKATMPVKVHIRQLLQKLDEADKYDNSESEGEESPDETEAFSPPTARAVDAMMLKYSKPSQTQEAGSSSTSINSQDSNDLPQQPIAKKKRSENSGPTPIISKDLPKQFQLPNQFGHMIDKKIKELKTPGSLPKDLRNRIIRQVETTVSAFNNHPSPKTVDWIAKSLCEKYSCLQHADARSALTGQQTNLDIEFKHWVLLKRKLQKRFENSRLQNKKMCSQHSDNNGPTPNKKSKLCSSLKKVSSERTETQEELQKHHTVLLKETLKTKPNKEVVTKMMDKLYDKREEH
ncbi:hypothetical protein AC249_AIPGENE24640 [Exaiptasia diaphana]|nr:hypothetical protein AC249_AIPGENE24640 [Exaiptasia diaphana]